MTWSLPELVVPDPQIFLEVREHKERRGEGRGGEGPPSGHSSELEIGFPTRSGKIEAQSGFKSTFHPLWAAALCWLPIDILLWLR